MFMVDDIAGAGGSAEISSPIERRATREGARAMRPIWVDHHQVKAMFALSRSTIYRLTEAGKIKAKKVSGRALWLVESIEDFIESQPELNARTGLKANSPNK